MGMHFKLGLYEHSPRAPFRVLWIRLAKQPALLDDANPALANRDHGLRAGVSHHRRSGQERTATRQTADHSMLYIVSTMLRKALRAEDNRDGSELMLVPDDYSRRGDPSIRSRTG